MFAVVVPLPGLCSIGDVKIQVVEGVAWHLRPDAVFLYRALKLTRSSIGWSPDDGVTCSQGYYSPATISSLWERGLLDANFTDLRVIYGARGLIDMKNLDGACYAHFPEMPKFQAWTSALGKKVLHSNGVELRYH
jgi:hypothetical protein